MNASAWRTWLWTSAAVTASGLALQWYARIEWPWLAFGWIALVPWLAALERMTSLRGAVGAGVLMSEGFMLAVFNWFPSAIQNYTAMPWSLALLVVILTAPLVQPQFVMVALARHIVRRRATTWWYVALASASIYVGAEWAIPKLFADTIGHGLYASLWMRQAADLGGAHGLTFVLIVANEGIFAALRAINQRMAFGGGTRSSAIAPVTCVITLMSSLIIYGVVRLQQLGDDERLGSAVTIGVVQANLSKYGQLANTIGTFDATRMILDTHFALSAEAIERGPLDLLVWPETVYPTTFGAPKSDDGAAFDRAIAAFVARTNVPLMFGAYDLEDGNEFNAAMLLEPATDGKLSFDTYRKHWLFPLIERVPALLDFELARRWMPWLGTWKAGQGPQVLPLHMRNGRTLRVAPLICYDAIDPGLALAAVRQGAEIIVTLSNDSWFDWENAPRLILIISAFRSLETRRPQVRATNTGLSAVITPTGEFLDTIGMNRRAILVSTVKSEGHATTLMLAWGDWFGPTALIAGVALLATALAMEPQKISTAPITRPLTSRPPL